jgi:hypothetical protein
MSEVVVVDGRFEQEPAKVIHKYRLVLLPDPVELSIPIGAKLLRAEFIQGWNPLEGHWLLWYEVPIANKANFHELVYQSMATGVEFPKCAKYVTTGFRWHDQQRLPAEVWHLYEYPSGARVVDI